MVYRRPMSIEQIRIYTLGAKPDLVKQIHREVDRTVAPLQEGLTVSVQEFDRTAQSEYKITIDGIAIDTMSSIEQALRHVRIEGSKLWRDETAEDDEIDGKSETEYWGNDDDREKSPWELEEERMAQEEESSTDDKDGEDDWDTTSWKDDMDDDGDLQLV